MLGRRSGGTLTTGLSENCNSVEDGTVKHIRIDAPTAVLDDLDAFAIDLNVYYDDAEPQAVIDNLLTGKIESLRAFCQTLGWSDIVTSMRDMTPLHGNAVESLELIQSFAVPEARRLLLRTEVEEVPSPTDWFWELVIHALRRSHVHGSKLASSVTRLKRHTRRSTMQRSGLSKRSTVGSSTVLAC